jgi:hypothetical protein
MPNPAHDPDLDETLDDDLTVDGGEEGEDGAGDGSEAGGDADEEGGGGTEGTSEADDGADSEGGATDDGQLVVSFGDDVADDDVGDDGKAAPSWIKDLRKQNRDKDRRIRDLERQVQSTAPAAPTVGPKPTMESCGFDADKFEADLTAWTERKAKADAAAADIQRQQEQQTQQWTRRLATVDAEEARLRIVGATDARESFEAQLSPLQQAIVLDGPDDAKTAAMLRIAIGRNPSVAARLRAIENPVKFSFAVAELVGKMKATKKGAPPAPEKRVRSGVAGAAAVDGALARLEAEAARTGDRTKVAQYYRNKAKATA